MRQSRDRGCSLRPLRSPRSNGYGCVMLSCSVALLALFASVQGRAVNISNTWVLPEEGFPVFYRYFRDRISWYEADAVCQFHHANLVTVDTTAQYDAVRAYLKELDISSAVWVGLIRSNPDGEFTWTDYRGLSGDGYWSSAPDARAAPLCAAADPAADYRWEARACGGPTVASFICELSVPQWALGNQGCMVRALPALTVLYLPESAAVQLTADCGLAGTKRVQCTGNVKRENLLRNLSCAENDDSSSTPSSITVGTTWSATTDTTYTDQETTSDVSTEESIPTVHEEEIAQANIIKPTSDSHNLLNSRPVIKHHTKINELNNMFSLKNINLDVINNNNLQSNDIPKLGNNEDFLSVEHTQKLEDEKHMQMKISHDEVARHGSFETIFTQPTDHFVPPLVMAKAKISNDMTVLSLAEKHAQQLAEQRFAKHNTQNKHNDHFYETNVKHKDKSSTEEPKGVESMDKPLVMTLLPIKIKDNSKKDNVKFGLPKKYLEKYDDPKGRNFKMIDNKLSKIDKSTEIPISSTESSPKLTKTTTVLVPETDKNISEEDSSMDLTVMLKELGMENSRTPLYTNHSDKAPEVKANQSNISLVQLDMDKATEKVTTNSQFVLKNKTENTIQNTVMNHEVIKITILNDEHSSNSTPIIFEVTTKTPDFDGAHNDNYLPTTTTQKSTENVGTNYGITTHSIKSTSASVPSTSTLRGELVTASVEDSTATSFNFDLKNESLFHSDNKTLTTEVIPTSVTDITTMQTTPKLKHETQDIGKLTTESATTIANILYTTTTDKVNVFTSNANDITEGYVKNSTDVMEAITEFQHNTEAATTTDNQNPTTREFIDIFNYTGSHEDDYAKNWTDSSETIDDFQSPLLSAANEPLHRPSRSRRPQQPNRLNKFNPFRILG